MHVLWVKMGGLWPPNTGGRLRSFQILSALARVHSVTLVTTVEPDDDLPGLLGALDGAVRVHVVAHTGAKHGTAAFARAYVESCFSSYPVDLWKWRVPSVRHTVRQLVREDRFDVVVADFLFAVANVGTSLPMVFFAHNVEHLIWQRLGQVESHWARRAALAVEWRKVRHQEARAVSRAQLTVAVSEADRSRLLTLAPSARVTTIPTGVDATWFRPDPAREVADRLVFSGSMDWFPNEEGIVHFADVILPLIRRERPMASLTIVGRNPSARVRALAERPGIHVTGTVDDVRPFIAEGEVYVVPLRVGGGTRLKICEALAMGKAVVSTTIGAEGLNLDPRRHIVLANTAQGFAASVNALLSDPARRQSLGEEGRRLVTERHSWDSVADVFGRSLIDALTRRDPLVATTRRAHLS